MERLPLDQNVFMNLERKKAMRQAVVELSNAGSTYFIDDAEEFLELKELQRQVTAFQRKHGYE